MYNREEDSDIDIRELEVELLDFTRTGTWTQVIRPSLERRQRNIEKKLAHGANYSIEKIRELQTIYKVISAILENPISFFSKRD